MKHLRAALARIAGIFERNHADDDVREELEMHLDMQTAEYARRGMSPADARRKAIIASGGLTSATEAVREQRRLPFIENIVADFRHAFRALGRSPAFTVVVIVTLALGIGANTAIFSVVRGVLLKPLPHRDGNRLVYLRQTAEGNSLRHAPFSVPEAADIRKGAPALEGLAEYSPWFHTLQEDGGALRVDAGLVTGNFFEVLGLGPVLGRLTRPSDDGKDAAPVMVLTHGFWTKHYRGDSSIVGRAVRVDGHMVTVIGVVQPAPFFPDRVDALLNMAISPHHLSAQMERDRSHRMTELIGRLAPGATIEQAQAQIADVQGRAEREFSHDYGPGAHYEATVVPLSQAMAERARMPLQLLIGAAGFVMLISIANVVNLTLMRGVRREHEFIVRAALGAGVSRLRRLLLVENLVLTFAGATFGITIAIGGVRLLALLAARYSPRANEVRLDSATLGFALAMSIGVALLLSFAALVPSGSTLATLLSPVTRRLKGGSEKQRLQRALVVAQIAVSVVLLAGAGLLTRTMLQLSEVDAGLRNGEVLTIAIPLLNPAEVNLASDAENKLLYQQMQREIRRLPGVVEVGLGSTMPLRTTPLEFDVRAEGDRPLTGAIAPHADFRTASPEYFRAAGIPLLKGREFLATDGLDSNRVVIVNQTFAERYFPGDDPIGKRIAWTGRVLRFTPVTDSWRTIVGVAGDTKDGGLDAEPRPVVFAPFAQEVAMLGGVVIRTERSAAALAPEATRIVRKIAPTVGIEDVLTVAQIKDRSVAPRRLNAALIASFAVLAAIIAAVGIAGVLAFSVSTRTNEIGIRMSLGAARIQVQRMILKEGCALVICGLLLGVGGAYVTARVIRGLLFGVGPHDPMTLAVVVIAMGAIGMAACWIPARRAAQVDPALTIRS